MFSARHREPLCLAAVYCARHREPLCLAAVYCVRHREPLCLAAVYCVRHGERALHHPCLRTSRSTAARQDPGLLIVIDPERKRDRDRGRDRDRDGDRERPRFLIGHVSCVVQWSCYVSCVVL